jgi:hypothetical protein
VKGRNKHAPSPSFTIDCHLVYLPTKKRRDSRSHTRAGQRVVCSKGHRCYGTLLTPQGDLGWYLHTPHVTCSQADRTGRFPEHWRHEALEDAGVILSGPSG